MFLFQRNISNRNDVLTQISEKWRRDKKRLPLTDAHRDLYQTIHVEYFNRLESFPNLIKCPDFNDKMQWLKLFDQNPDIVSCMDRIKLADYVLAKVGASFSPVIYQIADNFDDLDLSALPDRFVLKVNHRSGGIILVKDKRVLDVGSAAQSLNSLLKILYGTEHGEWAYKHITPRVYAEKLLPSETDHPPPDYKFYCVDGRARFMHFIFDRGENTKQQVIDLDGNDLKIKLAHTIDIGIGFTKPSNWSDMIGIAEDISAGFKFVRVDLYNIAGRICVGEMTFWPWAGFYLGEGQRQISHLLPIDRSSVRPPIDC